MTAKEKKNFFSIIEHVSDTGIEVKAESLGKLFELSAEAMFSIICDLSLVMKKTKIEVKISEEVNNSDEEMLVLWLEKLLWLFEVKNMLFSKFEIKKIQDGSFLLADIFGEKINPERHEIYIGIKAPTYHKLLAKKNDITGLWEARVIFDV